VTEDRKLSNWDRYVEQIEFLLRMVSNVVRRRGREILVDFDITPPQFTALQVLMRHGRLTMGELGDLMYLASSTLTDLVDRMEKNHYVERERDDKDRRVIRLRVTPAGEEVFNAVMAKRRQYLSSVLGRMSPSEIIRLDEALHQIYDIMAQEEVDLRDYETPADKH